MSADIKTREGFGRIEELIEYFERGKAFSEELMKENERLRLRVLRLDKENIELSESLNNARLKALRDENEKLRSQMEALSARFNLAEKENADFAHRYLEIQGQNDNLLSLYVSSYQLHSTLDPDEVIQVIQEIILNLIGAEQYFIAMIDPRTRRPAIVAGEGPKGPLSRRELTEFDPVLLKVLGEGREHFAEPGDESTHLACTPLRVKDDVVGAISITKLFDQKKDGLTMIDHELLGLLSDHAATALMSSHLYHRTERKLKTVEGFLDLLKTNGLDRAQS